MENKLTISRASIKFGLILGLAQVAFFIITVLLGIEQDNPISYISYAIIIGLLIYALLEVRRVNESLTYGEAVGIGSLTSGIGGAISGLVSAVYIWLDPSYLEKIKEKAMEKIYENPDMTDEALEMTEKMMDFSFSPGAIFFYAVFGTLILGLIVSLILGLILKRNPPVQY